jgi:hypothetical protein
MRCGICCFEASTGSGYGIQVEEQVHVREVSSSRPNMSKKELKAVRSLRFNMDIRILQADKGNCTVVLD